MKFRISLSQDQIQWILSCPDCPTDLKKQLRVHLLKIDEGLVQPAYAIVTPTPKTKKDLPLEQRYKMALRFLDHGDPIPDELLAAYNEYRYLNDLMSDEESEQYAETNGF